MISAYAIKKLLVLGIWITIGLLFIPLARDRGRSWILWYVLGLAGFYVPFLILLYGPIAITAMIVPPGPEGPETLGKVVAVCLPIALGAGIYCVRRLRKHLRDLE